MQNQSEPHKSIWLQWGLDDVPWDTDAVYTDDVKYIRADVHTALVEAVEIASNLLREDLSGFDTIEDQIDYIRLRLDTALAAAQEQDDA